jgi:hypothetical protein
LLIRRSYDGVMSSMVVEKKDYEVIFRTRGPNNENYVEVVNKLFVGDWNGTKEEYYREMRQPGSIGGTQKNTVL